MTSAPALSLASTSSLPPHLPSSSNASSSSSSSSAPLISNSSPVIAPAHLQLLGAAAPIQTFFASNNGSEHRDPLIDQPGNRAIIEGAFHSLEQQFAAQGKRLLYIYPRSLKAEWEDMATGAKGFSFLNANDPDIRALRHVYAQATGGKDGKEHLHHVGSWTYRREGLRGDGNGTMPLQRGSARLDRHFHAFADEHMDHALNGSRTPAQKVGALRRLYLANETSAFFSRLIQNRIARFQALLAAENDLDRRDALQRIIEKYRAMERLFEQDPFAVRWALTHPILGNNIEECHANLQQRVQELETVVQSKKGERLSVNPASNLLPGLGPLINKGINAAFDRTDDALHPNEKEYARDVLELGLCIPGQPDAERHAYAAICKRDGRREKNDSLEFALVKFIRAIDSSQATAADEFCAHLLFEEFMTGLPPGEQQLMRAQISGFANTLTQRANALRPANVPLTAAMTPQQCRQTFKTARAAHATHPFPPLP